MKSIYIIIFIVGFNGTSGLAQSQIVSDSLVASRFHQLSDSSAQAENFSGAIDYKYKELEIHLKFNDAEPIVKCAERLALLYYHLGNYHQSLKFYERTSSFHKSNDNLFSFATNKVNVGNVYTRLGKYSEAIKQMQFAEEVYAQDTLNYANQLVGLYTNLGLAYTDLPNIDSASYYYTKANESNEIAQNELYTAVILNNQGDIYLQQDSVEKAESYYLQALEIASNLEYTLLIGTAQLNIGRVYTKRGDYKNAIIILKKALENYNKIESLFFIAETNRELSNCYSQMGDHTLALFHLKEFNYLEDSLKGSQTLDRISNLEMEVALQTEKRKYELVEREKELAETNANYQQMYLYFMIGLIILGLALALVIIRALRISLEKNKLKSKHFKQRQELLRKEVDFKKKEIENFSTYVIEKNGILNEVKSQLSLLRKDYPESTLVNNALQSINFNLQVDNDRKELELKIDQAHQEFISRLLKSYPNLTKTEQRLCSLLIMELSSKEISEIMNITPESVKKSRNRLRKKMELEAKTNLTTFLKVI